MPKKLFTLVKNAAKLASQAWKPRPWFSVKNEAADAAAEIMIYDRIGKDYWSDEGVGAKDFNDSLKQIPQGRAIVVRINSRGGNVHDGLAIYNMLAARSESVTTVVEGVAASIASVIFMAGGKRVMPANALLMVHEPSALVDANAEEMRKHADMLDKHAESIASVYAEGSSKSAEEWRAMMRTETWITGADAKELGACEEVTNEIAISACVDFDLENFRNAPESLQKLVNKNKSSPAKSSEANAESNIMYTREEMIALLKGAGVDVLNDISDADLKAKVKEVLNRKQTPAPQTPAPAPGSPSAELLEIRAERDQLKRERVTARVKALQPNRIPIGQVENWVNRAVKDESVLTDLEAIELKPVAEAPLYSLECVGESVKDISAHIVRNGPGLTRGFIFNNADKEVGAHEKKAIREGAVAVANTYAKHRKMLLEVLNTNTLDASMQRTVILQEMVRAYETPIIPLTQFCTLFSNVPLEGNDKLEVPYFDLQGVGESKQFTYAAGYTMTGNTVQTMRELQIGGNGVAADAGDGANVVAGTARGRMYQDVSFTSYERARQPYLNIEQAFTMKAEQLAVDLFAEIVRRVLIAGNGYAIALTRAAAAFTSDDIANLWEKSQTAKWPSQGRSLVFAHTYLTSLLKDPAFKAVYASGSDETLRRAEIKQAYGFDNITPVTSLDNYMAANAAGWIAHASAAMIGTAPIMPTEDVRRQLSRYEVVTNPKSGATFEYRRWGNPDGDVTREVVEVSYGGARLREASLQLIKKQ